MKRRIFLALLLTAAACGASSARAQTQTVAPQVPPDRITLEEFKRLRAENKIFVLDVRVGINTKIKGAAYIPLDQLESRLSELPRDREIITYCSWPQEHTSARAAQILRDKSFKARALLGGFPGWVAAGGETEPVAEATTNATPQPTTNTQPVTAPPNPTTNDSKPPATVAPKNTDGATTQSTGTTTQAPTKTKSRKSKHRRTKPSSD